MMPMEGPKTPSPVREFTLLLTQSGGETLHVHARCSQGEANAQIDLPAFLREGETLSGDDGLLRRDVASKCLVPPLESPGLEDFGIRLYQILFNGDVGNLLQNFRGALGEENARLCIEFASDALDCIDWELLHDGKGFLALHPNWNIVRYLHTSHPAKEVSFKTPLRILALIAAPRDMPPLDVEAERQEIERSWQTSPSVEIVFVDPPTEETLMRKLKEPFDILHFIGHGNLDERSIFLENPGRTQRPVDGEVLANFLQGRQQPSLVVLNACGTASAAASLVRAGIPAVLAMKTSVRDSSATVFSAALHEALSKGEPVDLAVTTARLALYAKDHDRIGWAIPSLYLRSEQSEPMKESHIHIKTHTETAKGSNVDLVGIAHHGLVPLLGDLPTVVVEHETGTIEAKENVNICGLSINSN